MLLLVAALSGPEVGPARGDGVGLARGDVLAGTGGGKVTHLSPAGAVLDSLDTTTGTTYTTGMCFLSSGDLLVTDFSSDRISEFNPSGNLVKADWATVAGIPESCTVDGSDNVYVGGPSGPTIWEFNSAGTQINSFTVTGGSGTGGTDWVALSADQCTLLYTGEGSEILSYNVCSHTQNRDFATDLPGPCYALRVRPDGEVMVACLSKALLLDKAGATSATYPIPGSSQLFAMNLDPDNSTFWTGDIGNGEISHVDIATGQILSQFPSNPATELAGLAIVGEITVAAQCSPASNQLGNPGFESPLSPASALPAPVTVGNWLPVGRAAAAPIQTQVTSHCGLFSGEVLNGYFAQDLATATDPNAPVNPFDPTQPFEFAFWFKPESLGNAVSLVQGWDRGGGAYTNLISMSLTARVDGGFQTNVVVDKRTLRGSPVVAADGWSELVATATGQGNPLTVKINGTPLRQTTLGHAHPGKRVTVLMGATGGPNSTGPTDVFYDDVYLGPPVSPVTISTAAFPDAKVGVPYHQTLTAAGGFPPYHWAITHGALPTPLTLDPATGAITGTPRVAGTYDFVVTATDTTFPPDQAPVPLSITVSPTGEPTFTLQGNGEGTVNPPHVAFVLVGDWWCPLGDHGTNACANPKKYTCSQQYSRSCLLEAQDFVGSLEHMVQTDYGPASDYRDELALFYCYPALDCGNQGFQQRLYNGAQYYGPITPGQAATPGSTLNSVAGSFGIGTQSDATNTVFVFLFAPPLVDVPNPQGKVPCSLDPHNFNTVVPGGPGQYGFNYADVYLEDYMHNCPSNGTVPALNGNSPEPTTPGQFATFATSHEIDEAITAPGGTTGWVVNGGQLADACAFRDLAGGAQSGKYYDFTRDTYGTVMAAFPQFSFNSVTCYPDISTSIPPA
jgi:hypothetical protein